MEALAAVPGVEHAAATSTAVPAPADPIRSRAIEIDGHPPADPRDPPASTTAWRRLDYFTVMRIPIRARTRVHLGAIARARRPVAIVSESMAQKYWPGRGSDRPAAQSPRRRLDHGRRRVAATSSRTGSTGGTRRRCIVRIAQAPTDYFGHRACARPAIRTTSRAPSGRRCCAWMPTQPVFEMMPMRLRAPRTDDRPAVPGRDHDRLRRARAAPGGGRPLRRDRLPGRAAPARDRPAHRARRIGARRDAHDGRPGAAPDADRRRASAWCCRSR